MLFNNIDRIRVFFTLNRDFNQYRIEYVLFELIKRNRTLFISDEVRQLIKFKFQISSSRVGPRRQNERRTMVIGTIRMKCFEIFFVYRLQRTLCNSRRNDQCSSPAYRCQTHRWIRQSRKPCSTISYLLVEQCSWTRITIATCPQIGKREITLIFINFCDEIVMIIIAYIIDK